MVEPPDSQFCAVIAEHTFSINGGRPKSAALMAAGWA
jgi:hypothetical protein